MIPYGNKSNYPTSIYGYPIKESEGKYSFGHIVLNNGNYAYYQNNLTLENRIGDGKFNNLYGYVPGNTTNIGLLAQSANWLNYSNRTNGHGLLYQDNYEDKPEIRCWSYCYQQFRFSNGNVIKVQESIYSKNGDAINNTYLGNGWYQNQNHKITYKTTIDGQYYGMWPVFAV